jgi:hypothetical protein
LGVTTRVGLFVSSPRSIPLSLHWSVGFPLLSLTRALCNKLSFVFIQNLLFDSLNHSASISRTVSHLLNKLLQKFFGTYRTDYFFTCFLFNFLTCISCNRTALFGYSFVLLKSYGLFFFAYFGCRSLG